MEIGDILNLYKGKKVLVTGHTGFKGSWLSIWLHLLGADVIGISLDPKTSKDNFVLSGIGNMITDYRADIRNLNVVHKIVEKEKPEFFFHLAAQPIVLDSYKDPVYTYQTNVMGTVNLLEIFRKSESLRVGVFITTDKCYENIEQNYYYKETDPMGGYDPYSSSKGASELIISSYRNSYFQDTNKKIASARAGNVIGGGDWSPYRLIVDLVKSIENRETVEIRNPLSTRPWQHVFEPLGGYLLLCARMMESQGYDEAWNFGPGRKGVVTVKSLVNSFIAEYGKGSWIDLSGKTTHHEAKLLALDISKAEKELGWEPVLELKDTIKYTVEWYENYQNSDVYQLCINQIERYKSQWKLSSGN